MSMVLLNLDPMSLQSNAWNPNEVDPINLEKLKNSIEKDGFARPIITRTVDGVHEIIGGEHRAAVAVELGLKEVPVLSLGEISDEQAKRFTIIDNTRYGEDDNAALSALLNEIGSIDDILSTLPIDEAELNNYFSHATLDEDFDSLDDLDDLDDPIDLLPLETGGSDSQIIRFKVSTANADSIQRKISEIQATQEIDTGDKLENAGEALVYLLFGEKNG